MGLSASSAISGAFERGRTTFLGLELLVVRGALVPREETELLAKTAIETLKSSAAPRVIDMCCGAGNLACAIAYHLPASRIWASDLTDACVALTRRNVEHQHLNDRVSVHQGDLFQGLSGLGLEGCVDAVVCNPPYISEKRLQGDRAPLLDLEPREAFAAGPYGIGIHQRVLREASAFLCTGGWLLFEVGLGQEHQVASLIDRSGKYEKVKFVSNAAGENRVVSARRNPSSS